MSDHRDVHQMPAPNSAAPSALVRLDDLDGYEVADGFPDPRGWKVKSRDGRDVGEVEGLIVDPRAMAVRYLEVALDEHAAGGRREHRIHVPVGLARLDDDHDDVLLDASFAGVAGFATADLSATPDAGDRRFDGAHFYGRRAVGRERERHLVRRQERLAPGERAVPAGETRIR